GASNVEFLKLDVVLPDLSKEILEDLNGWVSPRLRRLRRLRRLGVGRLRRLRRLRWLRLLVRARRRCGRLWEIGTLVARHFGLACTRPRQKSMCRPTQTRACQRA